jgi:hypothetical protein
LSNTNSSDLDSDTSETATSISRPSRGQAKRSPPRVPEKVFRSEEIGREQDKKIYNYLDKTHKAYAFDGSNSNGLIRHPSRRPVSPRLWRCEPQIGTYRVDNSRAVLARREFRDMTTSGLFWTTLFIRSSNGAERDDLYLGRF